MAHKNVRVVSAGSARCMIVEQYFEQHSTLLYQGLIFLNDQPSLTMEQDLLELSGLRAYQAPILRWSSLLVFQEMRAGEAR
jgi:hypothetical protein